MPFDAETKVENKDKLILQRARDRIAKGWCSGLLDYKGGTCIIGAIYEAVTGNKLNEETPEPYQVAPPYLPLLGFHPYSIMAGKENKEYTISSAEQAYIFNDAPGRTKAEVLARFDEAIAKL